MPLLDHFHEPLHPQRSWESFLSNWATRLADRLTDLVSRDFLVEEFCPGTPDPTRDTVEILVFPAGRLATVVGAIELISPRNREPREARLAFAGKCAGYLQKGAGVVLMDIVTTGTANLHDELMRLLAIDAEPRISNDDGQYAVAYAPVLREKRPMMDVWPATFAVGDTLPTLPLRLTGDLFVPVDFEATYQEACRRRKLA